MNKNFIDEEIEEMPEEDMLAQLMGVKPGEQPDMETDAEELPEEDEGENESTDWELERQRANAVQTCFNWFDSDRVAKAPFNAEMDEMYKLFKSDHWDLLDANGVVLRTDAQKANHPNAVENIAFALIEGLVAEFSEPREIIDYPVEEGDDEIALVMTELKQYIRYKNGIEMELIKWLRWFFLYGTGIWSVTWDPNWRGGKGPNRWEGDIRWKARHPRSIFPDARCMDSFEDGRRIHDANYYPIETVTEKWPDAENISPDSISDDIIVSDDLEYSTAEASEDMVLVVDTWYKGSPMILEGDEEDEGTGLHLIQWAGEGTLKYLSHQNYCYFDPDEDTTFPIKGEKCYDRERSPWGLSEAYQLKNPQIIANKTAEMIIEGHLYEALGQTWYDANALSEKQKRIVREKGTLYGMWIEMLDVDRVKRVYGKGVPASLENEMGRLGKVMETIVGRFDISQGKTPGSITAFRALDLMASRAQVRLRSKEMTMNNAEQDSANYANRIIAKHYNEKRKYRILGEEDNIPKFGTYDANAMKRAYMFDSDEVMPYSELEPMLQSQQDLPPEQQLVEGEHFEVYSPEFDAKCKISTSLATDRVFYMEMAKELLAGGLLDMESFFYVIENGKFPPMEQVLERVMAMQQQQAQQQAQLQQGPAGPESAGPEGLSPEIQQLAMQFLEYLKVEDPETLMEIAKLPPEQQIAVLLQMIKDTGWTPDQAPGAGAGMQPVEGPPPEADAQAIKQQLMDILEIQRGGQSIQ